MRKERLLRWTLASDQFSRNNFWQEGFLCLAFGMRVLYVSLDGTAERNFGYRLCVTPAPVGDHGTDWPK